MLKNRESHAAIDDIEEQSLKKILQALIREKVLPFRRERARLLFDLPITKQVISVDAVQWATLNRVIKVGQVFVDGTQGDRHQVKNSLELLKIVALELQKVTDQSAWEKLSIEIADHLRNARLVDRQTRLFNNMISHESKNKNHKNFFQWITTNKSIFNKELFIEQWASQGHPYHPCSKTKLGLSDEEIISYSPEFHPVVRLMIVAVRHDYLHVESMQPSDDFAQWFAQEFPTTWLLWQQALTEKQLLPDHYLPIPVHPWQAEKIIPDVFNELIAKNIIYLLPQVVIEASPTLSFRTLAPVEDRGSAYIKLPIAVQATSVFRTLSPGSTENAPRVSKLLSDIFARENYFSGRLSLLRETYGLHLKQVSDDQGKQLTAIFRENVQTQLASDEMGVVIAALFETSAVSGLSLFIEHVEEAGVRNVNEAMDYFRRYVNFILPSYLDLYLMYGIALEGHQQNTLAVFRHGKIVRFIARDFDGICIHAPTLRNRGFDFNPYPGSACVTDKIEEVRNTLIHTVYQSHLGEIILLLAKHTNGDESHFWQIVKEATIERFAYGRDKMDPTTWEMEYNAIVNADWPCKALLRMRLMKEYKAEGLFFTVDNPL